MALVRVSTLKVLTIANVVQAIDTLRLERAKMSMSVKRRLPPAPTTAPTRMVHLFAIAQATTGEDHWAMTVTRM